MVKMTVIDKIVGSALDMVSIGFVSGKTLYFFQLSFK